MEKACWNVRDEWIWYSNAVFCKPLNLERIEQYIDSTPIEPLLNLNCTFKSNFFCRKSPTLNRLLSRTCARRRSKISMGRECVWPCFSRRSCFFFARGISIREEGTGPEIHSLRNRCGWWKRISLQSAVTIQKVKVMDDSWVSIGWVQRMRVSKSSWIGDLITWLTQLALLKQ